MNKSETIGKIAEALAIAQGMMEGAKKDSTNPFFKTKYSDLASVWEACRQPLSKNGLSVSQIVNSADDGSPAITTILMHSSGEWLSGELVMRITKIDPQTIGSATTYGRRYALAAIVGIAPEDDDAETAQAREHAPPQSQKTQPQRKSEVPAAAKIEDNPFGATDTNTNVTISNVATKSGEKNGKKWYKYTITASNGIIYSTFSDTHGQIATEAMESQADVKISGVEGQYGWEMKRIEIIPQFSTAEPITAWSLEKIVSIISASDSIAVLDANWKSLLPHIGKLDTAGKAECQKAYNALKDLIAGDVE